MTPTELTQEERRSLQLWFRQAIARLEQEEATSTLIRRHGLNEENSHRSPMMRRRSRRTSQAVHNCEVV